MKQQPPPMHDTDRARTVGPGVRRVNNLPLFLIIGLVALFAIVMVVVTISRSDKMNKAKEQKDYAGDTSVMAGEAAGNLEAGIIGSYKPIVVAAAGTDPDAPPAPPEPDPLVKAMYEKRLAALQQAIAARSQVPGAVATGMDRGAARGGMPERYKLPQTPGQPASGLVPNQEAYQQYQDQMLQNNSRLEQQLLQQLASASAAPAPAAEASQEAQRVDQIDLYGGAGDGDRWKLDTRVEAPAAYMLRAGFVIPGVMISGINSELRGQVIGQISENVYDTATGRHLLLPQGTRLIGTQRSSTSRSARRVFVAWQRLVFPDGRALDIEAMQGADGLGRSGVTDKVNGHVMKALLNAVLVSAVVAGVSYSTDDRRSSFFDDDRDLADEYNRSFAREMGNTMRALIDRSLNVSPTLDIRPGYRFNIMVSKDLDLKKPYRAFAY